MGTVWREVEKIIHHLVGSSEERVIRSFDRLQRFKEDGGQKILIIGERGRR
jgi:hypothetical protein